MPELSRFFGIIISHAIYRVTSFELLAAYTLRVTFDDDTQRTIDFEDVLAGDHYHPLRDLVLFNQVRIDPEVHTLVWPNGADFDPETLHDWPRYRDALIERARQWERQRAQQDLQLMARHRVD